MLLTNFYKHSRMITSFFIIFFLSYGEAFAVPGISKFNGTFINNEIISITGSEFGNKPIASPLKWEQFEGTGAIAGKDIGSAGYWDTYNSITTFNNTLQRTNNSSLNAKSVVEGDVLKDGPFHRENVGFATTLKTYINMWVYINYVTGDGGGNDQLKLWRIHKDKDHASRPVLSFNLVTVDYVYAKSAIPNMFRGDGSNQYISWFVASHWREGRWINIELEYKDSTINIADGGHTIWYSKASGAMEKRTQNPYVTRTDAKTIDCVSLGYQIVNMGDVGEAITYWDDIYIDNSWARVVIGDNVDYDSCTHREIQIPTAWSDKTITVSVNQGTFKSGDTAYLFVVDANGNVSNGYPITIGSGSGGGTPTDTPPTISITSPTSAASYTSPENIITISGTAADDKLITGIKWVNSSGGSGNAIDSAGNWSKFFADISLKEGENVITVTATDSNSKTSSDTLTVTYNSNNMAQSFSAIKQTADSNWKDSGVTYCVRLLIEGAHITQSGGHIILGFKGRSSGDYSIRKVSIAERDVNSSVGNVVDSTWTRVTFNGKAYNTWELDEAVVLAGTEKQSDPIPFSIEAGKDYYVTFKIVSPSVYLSPPSSYKELYFWDADHASDIDWAGNGHSLTQDYHALSSIYVISNTDLLPPRDVTNVNYSKNGSVLTFTWTNPKSTENGSLIPENKDFAGVMIRYNTGKGALPPASHSEGTLFFDKPGNLDTNDSCTNTIGLGQDYSFSLFTYDSSGNFSHTVYVTVDANPPGVIKNFIASSGEKQITLSWTNPSDQDYAGTVIRYAANAYPSGEKDGSLVVDKKGTPSGNSSFIHGGLQNDLTYYYSAFAYDPSGNYSEAVNVSKAPSVPLDTTPPAPPTGTTAK